MLTLCSQELVLLGLVLVHTNQQKQQLVAIVANIVLASKVLLTTSIVLQLLLLLLFLATTSYYILYNILQKAVVGSSRQYNAHTNYYLYVQYTVCMRWCIVYTSTVYHYDHYNALYILVLVLVLVYQKYQRGQGMLYRMVDTHNKELVHHYIITSYTSTSTRQYILLLVSLFTIYYQLYIETANSIYYQY